MGWSVAALVVGLAVGATVALVWRHAATASARAAQAQESAERTDVLQRTVEEMRAALHALPLGVVVVDTSGAEVVRNRQAEHFLGVHYLDAIVDEAVATHLQDALEGRERSDRLEVYGPPRRTLVVRGSVVSVGEEQVGAMTTIEDVSEQVRLDSVRTDLVANMSHELKTPVGAIALLAETLADEDEPEVIARLAPKLIAEAHRLSRIIDELLELSRIELGGQSLAEVVDVNSVVGEAVALHQALADAHGIPVYLYQADVRPSVLGNRRQLLSAVSNLVENAIKYSDAGADVIVDVEVEDGTVVLTVSDHGMGIPGPGPRPRVRALLPGRQGPQPGDGR